jgi:4,5-dihydroxyphthalate decarboxylase
MPNYAALHKYIFCGDLNIMTHLTLRAGLRSMPLTDPLLNGHVDSGRLTITPCGATPYTDTFRRMARDLAYDIAEMPVATQLLLADAAAPVTAMPIVLAGGGLPHGSLLSLVDSQFDAPATLRGKRIGIRAYAQTTGVWIRGVLQHEFDVAPEDVTWVTTEGSHVPSFTDPANVLRVRETDLVAMLRSGQVDAIVASPHVVKGTTDLRCVVPDAQAAGQAWAKRERVHGVNHVLSVQTVLIERNPWVVDELARCFVAARNWAGQHADDGKRFVPFGDDANRRSIDLMLRYAYEQRLSARRFEYDELFAAWPEALRFGDASGSETVST